MATPTLCTVVIPCYNAMGTLRETVRSLQQQAFTGWEAVLVDDHSTDQTLAMALEISRADSRFSVVARGRNGWASAARNDGARLARTPYLAFLDSDDVYDPAFLDRLVTYLERTPDADAVRCLPRIDVPCHPLQVRAVANSLITTMVVRRGPFFACGGFPESPVLRQTKAGGEDLAFWRLFLNSFRCDEISETHYNYRFRPGSHLDHFLRRSSVRDGKIVLTDVADDAIVVEEINRLVRLQRDRIRKLFREEGHVYLEGIVLQRDPTL